MAVRSHFRTVHDTVVVIDTQILTWLLALGRAIFGGYFIYASMHHFSDHVALAGYAARRGVPFADAAIFGTGLMLLVGGLSILTATAPRVGAALIALFLICVTPTMHAFWRDTDLAQRAADLTNFGKNVALLGATCFVAALPTPWPRMFTRHGLDVVDHDGH
jgi:uncharacterized membrane protein YphA (DoxX/SURF4 family)